MAESDSRSHHQSPWEKPSAACWTSYRSGVGAATPTTRQGQREPTKKIFEACAVKGIREADSMLMHSVWAHAEMICTVAMSHHRVLFVQNHDPLTSTTSGTWPEARADSTWAMCAT